MTPGFKPQLCHYWHDFGQINEPLWALVSPFLKWGSKDINNWALLLPTGVAILLDQRAKGEGGRGHNRPHLPHGWAHWALPLGYISRPASISNRGQIWGLHLPPLCFINVPGRERECFSWGSLRKFPPSRENLALWLVHGKCWAEVPRSRSRGRWLLRVCLVTGLLHNDAHDSLRHKT